MDSTIMKSIKRIMVAVLMCAGLFFTAQASMAAETLNVGVSLGLSGAGGPWGVSILKGWQLHVDQINNAGGLKVGNKRYLIKLIPGDDLYTAAGGRSVAEKLVFRDKVKFVLGPLSSAAAASAVPIFEQNGVLSIPMCATYTFFGPKTPLCFKFHLTTTLVAYNMPWLVAKNFPDVKNIVSCHNNDESGIEVEKMFERGLKELDEEQPKRLKLVKTVATELKMPDWAPTATQVLAAKPDIIAFNTVAAEGALFVKALREQGYTGPVINPSVLDAALARKVAGLDYAYGIWHFGVDWENPSTPELKKYSKEFKAAYNELPLDCQVWSVDHIPLLAAGIEKANSIDPQKVAKALESMTSVPSMFGNAYWGGQDIWGLNHQLFKPQMLSEIVKGGINTGRGVMEVKLPKTK